MLQDCRPAVARASDVSVAVMAYAARLSGRRFSPTGRGEVTIWLWHRARNGTFSPVLILWVRGQNPEMDTSASNDQLAHLPIVLALGAMDSFVERLVFIPVVQRIIAEAARLAIPRPNDMRCPVLVNQMDLSHYFGYQLPSKAPWETRQGGTPIPDDPGTDVWTSIRRSPGD